VPYLLSLDADRTLANAEATLAESDAQIAYYQVSVFQSLGGGWQQDHSPLSRADCGFADASVSPLTRSVTGRRSTAGPRL
jgi:hypothetical protein